MNTNYSSLKIELLAEERLAILQINRPLALNSLNSQVLQELEDFLKSFHQNRGDLYRGLILIGSGDKAFIAGADIKEMSEMNIQSAEEFGALGQRVGLLIEKLSVPVIAAVNGHALGGGLEMALSCDFIYATKNASFGLPEVKLGLIPGFGGTQRLARIVGRNRAKEMIYSGKRISAEEAKQIRLVLEIVETRDELIALCKAKFKEIIGNSPLAVATAKKVINAGNDLPIQEGLGIELDQFANCFNSPERAEGIQAFIEKRSPRF